MDSGKIGGVRFEDGFLADGVEKKMFEVKEDLVELFLLLPFLFLFFFSLIRVVVMKGKWWRCSFVLRRVSAAGDQL